MIVIVMMMVVVVIVIRALGLRRGECDGLAVRCVEVGAAPGFDPVLQRPAGLG